MIRRRYGVSDENFDEFARGRREPGAEFKIEEVLDRRSTACKLEPLNT